MNKKRKLNVLNPAETRPQTGGTEAASTCNKSGDTILCSPIADVKVCKHFEARCPSNFSSNCSIFSKVTISCPSKFTVGGKQADET